MKRADTIPFTVYCGKLTFRRGCGKPVDIHLPPTPILGGCAILYVYVNFNVGQSGRTASLPDFPAECNGDRVACENRTTSQSLSEDPGLYRGGVDRAGNPRRVSRR